MVIVLQEQYTIMSTFLKNRLGKPALNVFQGFDIPTGDVWYDAVKHFPFEGWAFGGNNMCDMTMALHA